MRCFGTKRNNITQKMLAMRCAKKYILNISNAAACLNATLAKSSYNMHALNIAAQYNANSSAQHKSTAKSNYYKFNAVRAYVQHTLALRIMQRAYSTLATNCANARNARVTLNSAIQVAQSKQQYAYKHYNFCVQTATQKLHAASKAQ